MLERRDVRSSHTHTSNSGRGDTTNGNNGGSGFRSGRTYDSSGATQEQLLQLIKRLNRALGLPPGRATDGVATASAQMLSKMVSRYEVTRVSIQQTQRTIEQNADDYRSFHDRYTSLKEEMEQPDPSDPSGPGSSGHLDRYLTVVARVLADKGLKETLTDVNRSKGPAATPGKKPSKERRAVGRDYDKENSTGGVNANILSPRAPAYTFGSSFRRESCCASRSFEFCAS